MVAQDPHLKLLSLDIETTGLGWDAKVLCISAAWTEWDPEECSVVVRSDAINTGMADLFYRPASVPDVVRWIDQRLDGADWVFLHNSSFDIPYMVRDGFISIPQLWDRTFDTMLMARQTGSHQSVSLENLCIEMGIGEVRDPFYSDMKKKRARLSKEDPERVMRYAKMDTERTLALGAVLLALSLEQYSLEHIKEEGNYTLHISEMRLRGVRLDVPGILEMIESKKPRLRDIQRKLLTQHRIHGPNDADRLIQYLRDADLSHYLGHTEKGKLSVDEASLLSIPGVQEYVDLLDRPVIEKGFVHDEDDLLRLEQLRRSPAVEVVSLVLTGRELDKQISTWLQGYLDVMDDGWRVHPLWGAAGTVSYRLNCTEPNAQAVAKSIYIWGSTPGYKTVDADYSQAELRLGAALAKEHKMAKIFKAGIDFHTGTAMEMYAIKDPAYFKTPDGKQKRRHAKTANFGGFYGGGWPALDRALHVGETMSKQIVRRWRETYKGVSKASKDAEDRWRTRGYVTLVHGTRLWASPDDLQHRIYKAFNQVVQGSIATITKRAMMNIRRQMPEVFQVAQIHDALKTEVPDVGKDQWYLDGIGEIMRDACPRFYLERTDPHIELLVDMEISG